MPAQVKADRYQLVPLGGEGNIVVNGHSIARSVLVAACILPTGKDIPGTAGVSSDGSGVAILRGIIGVVVSTLGPCAAVQVIAKAVASLFFLLVNLFVAVLALFSNGTDVGAGSIGF